MKTQERNQPAILLNEKYELDMKRILYMSLLAVLAAFAACTPKEPQTGTPVISAGKNVSVDAAGGEFRIEYSIENPAKGKTLAAEENCEWLEIKSVAEDAVIAYAAANEAEESRTASIILSYAGAENMEVSVTQAGTSGEAPAALSFDIKIKSIASRSVVVDCIPSDENATYIAMSSDKDYYYSIEEGSDEFFQQDIDYFIEWGMTFGEEGITEEECIEMFLRQGSMIDYEITLDKPMSDYVFYAYGLNSDGTVTSDVYKVEFTTTKPEQKDCTFEFMIRPSLEGVRVNVFPSDIYVQYYWAVKSKAEFEAYGEDAADKIAAELLEQSKEDGTGMGQVLYYHNQSQAFNKLDEGGEYVAFAFGCDVSGVVTTELMKKEFRAETLEKVSCSFDVSTVDLRAATFTVEITPSDPDIRWFAYTMPYEMLELYVSAEEMTEEALNILCATGIDWATDTELVHTGTMTLSNYDLLGERTTPDTRQFVGVMAISEYGTRISDLTFYTLVTASDDLSGDMDIEVTIDVMDNTVSNAAVKFTPVPEEQFVYGVLPTSFFEGLDSVDDKTAAVLSYYVINDLLKSRLSYDEVVYNPADLEAGVEYTAFAFGYADIVGKTFFSETFTAQL